MVESTTARASLILGREAVLPAVCPDTADEIVALFDRFRDRLLRYVLSMGVSGPDGEDLIQEVFLSLYRHLRLGKSRCNLPGWLFRVAHNLALKQRNRKQKRDARTELDPRAFRNHLDPLANPEEQLAEGERHRQLLAVVDALAEKDRWCLYLRAEGLRYREIADTLEMSLGAVSNSLSRSMARIARVSAR